MSNYKLKTNKKVEESVVGIYKKIEDTVVNSYKSIENGAVNTYKKIEDKFVETFLEKTNDDKQLFFRKGINTITFLVLDVI